MASACTIKFREVVQGVAFRPFVYRLARANTLAGWVLNGEEGVEIFVEGADQGLNAFVQALTAAPPSAAQIGDIEVESSAPVGCNDFTIRESRRNAGDPLTARISAALPVCDDCVRELFDPADRRHLYPYINCTNCGPRYSVVLALPYDRPNTTMKAWPLDEFCEAEYLNPANRRFHAQPVACPSCGPNYFLELNGTKLRGGAAILKTAELLRHGSIVAVKGIGGYHLACDAQNPEVVDLLRQRKFRKEQPFAIMARNTAAARDVVELSEDEEQLLNSVAKPIVLARAKVRLPGVAPDNN